MTPSDLRMALVARYTYDNLQQRQQWEQSRLISYFALAPHVKKGTVKQPKDLLAFPWEETLVPKSRDIKHIPEGWKNFIKRNDEKDGIKTKGIY
jgi:hypothetical protein